MLAATYTLGTSGNAATYEKLNDTETAAFFAVSGLALNVAEKLRFGHETSNSGKLRGDLAELTWQRPVPGSITGEVRTDRVATTLKRSEFTTLAQFLAMAERQSMLLGNVTLMTKLFNGEL